MIFLSLNPSSGLSIFADAPVFFAIVFATFGLTSSSKKIRFAKEHQVKTIFFEELVSPKVAKTIAKETGANAKMLNPLEGLSNKKIKAGEDYFSVMKQNLAAIKEALSE